MGAYITSSDLNRSQAYLTWLTGASGTPNQTYLDDAILDAESVVKSYLGTTYTLPLDDANETDLVKNISKKLTIYHLYLNHESAELPDKWEIEYQRTIDMLKAVSARKQTLGADTATEKEMTRPMFTNSVRG